MNKRYITGCVFKSVSNPENGITKVDVKWTIDFSRLPQMRFLLDFISYAFTNEDFISIDPTLDYIGNDHYDSFTFTTTASSKVSDKDTYNEDTGYHIALMRNQKKALHTYNKLIDTINNKIDKYFKKPLDRIELNNDFDIIDLHMKLDEYRTNIKVRIC